MFQVETFSLSIAQLFLHFWFVSKGRRSNVELQNEESQNNVHRMPKCRKITENVVFFTQS
jgi:hypothetical protein